LAAEIPSVENIEGTLEGSFRAAYDTRTARNKNLTGVGNAESSIGVPAIERNRTREIACSLFLRKGAP